MSALRSDSIEHPLPVSRDKMANRNGERPVIIRKNEVIGRQQELAGMNNGPAAIMAGGHIHIPTMAHPLTAFLLSSTHGRDGQDTGHKWPGGH